MKKKLLIVLSLLAAAIIAAFFVFRSPAPKIEREAKLEQRDISLSFRLTGDVNPRNRIEIKPQFSGRIEAILANEGDYVRKGQVLIKMSSSERAAMLDAARGLSDEEYQRWQDIYKESPIAAPMNGFIILRSKEPGQSITAADVVLAMADDLVIDANVDETDLKHIAIGKIVRVYLDAYPDEVFEGIIEHIAYEARIVSNVTVYTARIRPKDKPKVFRSGMTATITVDIESKQGVWALPSDFINNAGGRSVAMVISSKKEKRESAPKEKKVIRKQEGEGLEQEAPQQAAGAENMRKQDGEPRQMPTIKTKNGLVEMRIVETGISDGRWTEIVSGLSPQETAVIVSMAKSKAQRPAMGGGMRVR